MDFEIAKDEKKIIDTGNLDNFKKAVSEFKEPKQGKHTLPYVLFGNWNIVYRPDGTGQYKHEMEYGTFCLVCKVRQPSLDKLNYYKSKGYKVLRFYFPYKQDAPPKTEVTEHGWIQTLRGSEDADPYLEARNWCKFQMESDTRKHDGIQRENSLLKENKSLLDELEKLKAEKSKDGNKKLQPCTG